MASRNTTKLLKRHRQLGILLALPLMLIALTGIVLGFYDILRYGAEPYRVENTGGAALSPQALVASLETRFPRRKVSRLYLATQQERSVRARLAGNPDLTVFLHPVTGALLAVREGSGMDWLDTIYHWHNGGVVGTLGQILASICGIGIALLWLLGASGKRTGQGYRWHGLSRKARMRVLHRWVGLFLAIPLPLVALSGALLNFAAPLKQWWLEPAPVATAPAISRHGLTTGQVLNTAHQAYPSAALQRIYFPDGNASYLFRLRFADGTWVSIAAGSGEVVAINSPKSHWLDWLYPLHSGRIMGPLGSGLIAMTGGTLLLLSMTGLLMLLRRRSLH